METRIIVGVLVGLVGCKKVTGDTPPPPPPASPAPSPSPTLPTLPTLVIDVPMIPIPSLAVDGGASPTTGADGGGAVTGCARLRACCDALAGGSQAQSYRGLCAQLEPARLLGSAADGLCDRAMDGVRSVATGRSLPSACGASSSGAGDAGAVAPAADASVATLTWQAWCTQNSAPYCTHCTATVGPACVPGFIRRCLGRHSPTEDSHRSQADQVTCGTALGGADCAAVLRGTYPAPCNPPTP
jgi:hypothetical protein